MADDTPSDTDHRRTWSGVVSAADVAEVASATFPVPLRLGVGGPVVGHATVGPDGTVTGTLSGEVTEAVTAGLVHHRRSADWDQLEQEWSTWQPGERPAIVDDPPPLPGISDAQATQLRERLSVWWAQHHGEHVTEVNPEQYQCGGGEVFDRVTSEADAAAEAAAVFTPAELADLATVFDPCWHPMRWEMADFDDRYRQAGL